MFSASDKVLTMVVVALIAWIWNDSQGRVAKDIGEIKNSVRMIKTSVGELQVGVAKINGKLEIEPSRNIHPQMASSWEQGYTVETGLTVQR